MNRPTDAFFFNTPYQSDSIDLVYLVTPAEMPDDGTVGEVFLTVGILGGDQDNQPLPDVGVMGLDEPIRVPFFAEPCDVNDDGRCDVDDINTLLAGLGSQDADLNLDPTNPEIDLGDRDEWLRDAGLSHGSALYVPGDTDLDGDVDAADLNNLALNWRQNGAIGWGAETSTVVARPTQRI